MAEIVLCSAFKEDAAEILAPQKICYMSEAKIIDDFTIPLLHQTLEAVRAEFNSRIKKQIKNEYFLFRHEYLFSPRGERDALRCLRADHYRFDNGGVD